MAVKAVYYSDKDGFEVAINNPEKLLFATKAEADQRDKTIELIDEIRDFLVRNIADLDSDTADKVGEVIAENKALFQKAFKKPSVLAEENQEMSKSEAASKTAKKNAGRKSASTK
ncbi:YebG family protein [Marinobacter shengliensis]|uniref:YebG family protein n=1 Tax=Marinobacter shengliensis TaxID=1389223 RepID=UPI001108783A|nr:YebG family protein [Marinobacter shengliensis]